MPDGLLRACDWRIPVKKTKKKRVIFFNSVVRQNCTVHLSPGTGRQDKNEAEPVEPSLWRMSGLCLDWNHVPWKSLCVCVCACVCVCFHIHLSMWISVSVCELAFMFDLHDFSAWAHVCVVSGGGIYVSALGACERCCLWASLQRRLAAAFIAQHTGPWL